MRLAALQCRRAVHDRLSCGTSVKPWVADLFFSHRLCGPLIGAFLKDVLGLVPGDVFVALVGPRIDEICVRFLG